jgi:hypothetical protein
MFNKFVFENHAFHDIMWKKFVKPDRLQMTAWRMRIACYITKATNSLSEYVILITFPLPQWLQARPSMLRYIYIAWIVVSFFETFVRDSTETPIGKHNKSSSSSSSPSSFLGTIANNEMQAMRRRQGKLE